MNKRTSKKIKDQVLTAIYGPEITKEQRKSGLKDKKTKAIVRSAKKNYVKGKPANPKLKISKRQKRIADQAKKENA